MSNPSFQQALVQALASQRDAGMNAAAQLEATIVVLHAEKAALEDKIKELEAQVAALTPTAQEGAGT